MRESWVQSLGWEDLEKETATHSSILAWKIPWTEEPGRVQSMGSQRVRHDWATSLSLSFKAKWWTNQREESLGEGIATHSSILAWTVPWTEEPGGLQSMGLQKSQTQPKWLSTHKAKWWINQSSLRYSPPPYRHAPQSCLLSPSLTSLIAPHLPMRGGALLQSNSIVPLSLCFFF